MLALASACGQSSSHAPGAGASRGAGGLGAGASSAPTATVSGDGPPPALGRCAAGTHTTCITVADRGRTIGVHVGSTFTVELRAPGRTFSAPTQSGAKVLERIGSSRSGSAAEAYYRARAPGRVELRSVERPVCRRGRACPQFLELWQAWVKVSSARPPSRAG